MARIDLYRDSRWVKSLPLAQRVHLIGRDPDADLVLSDPLCSRRHLHIDWVDGVFVMKDLDTSNGTMVDGVREYSRRLSSNVTIQIGKDMLLFQPDAGGEEPREDDELPGWAFRGLEEATQDMPATGMMAPAALQRVQARTRLRTRPHLLRRVKDNNPEIFALTLDVTPIGTGSTRVSIGDGKDRILAEVVKSKDGYRVKAKGLFSKMTVNGKATRKALLAVRDRIEIDGVILEFHPGLEGRK